MSDIFKEFKGSEEGYTEVSISNMQNRIIDLLETQEMTKADLARKMKISKQNLNDFFTEGHNATFKTIGKVAHALNKKVVVSFVEKNTDNKKFYNYVKNYKSFENEPVGASIDNVSISEESILNDKSKIAKDLFLEKINEPITFSYIAKIIKESMLAYEHKSIEDFLSSYNKNINKNTSDKKMDDYTEKKDFWKAS